MRLPVSNRVPPSGRVLPPEAGRSGGKPATARGRIPSAAARIASATLVRRLMTGRHRDENAESGAQFPSRPRLARARCRQSVAHRAVAARDSVSAGCRGPRRAVVGGAAAAARRTRDGSPLSQPRHRLPRRITRGGRVHHRRRDGQGLPRPAERAAADRGLPLRRGPVRPGRSGPLREHRAGDRSGDRVAPRHGRSARGARGRLGARARVPLQGRPRAAPGATAHHHGRAAARGRPVGDAAAAAREARRSPVRAGRHPDSDEPLGHCQLPGTLARGRGARQPPAGTAGHRGLIGRNQARILDRSRFDALVAAI